MERTHESRIRLEATAARCCTGDDDVVMIDGVRSVEQKELDDLGDRTRLLEAIHRV
jgi:hypothetical protein